MRGGELLIYNEMNKISFKKWKMKQWEGVKRKYNNQIGENHC